MHNVGFKHFKYSKYIKPSHITKGKTFLDNILEEKTYK